MKKEHIVILALVGFILLISFIYYRDSKKIGVSVRSLIKQTDTNNKLYEQVITNLKRELVVAKHLLIKESASGGEKEKGAAPSEPTKS